MMFISHGESIFFWCYSEFIVQAVQGQEKNKLLSHISFVRKHKLPGNLPTHPVYLDSLSCYYIVGFVLTWWNIWLQF